MKLKHTMRAAVSALAISTTAALAAVDVNALAQSYVELGYDRVEVKVGITQVKVEAVQGTTKVEVVYDKQTGEVLKRETSTVSADNDVSDGVSIKNRLGDFTSDDENDESSDDGEDDDDEDDSDEDSDEDDDDEEDDDEEDDE